MDLEQALKFCSYPGLQITVALRLSLASHHTHTPWKSLSIAVTLGTLAEGTLLWTTIKCHVAPILFLPLQPLKIMVSHVFIHTNINLLPLLSSRSFQFFQNMSSHFLPCLFYHFVILLEWPWQYTYQRREKPYVLR